MPVFALIAGASGYYLRLLELWDVFDTRTGLPVRGAGITYALIAVSFGFLGLILAFSLRTRLKYTSPKGFDNAFGTDPLAYPFIFLLVGLVWFAASVKHFIDLYTLETVPMQEVYFSALSALSAISTSFFAIEVYQNPHRKTKLALSLVPTVFMCFWLILLYRKNAANPILLSYCYQCLAIIFTALSFYFTSGFVFSRPAPSKAAFAYFAAIFFCFVTLADNHTIYIKMIFMSFIVINVVHSSMLIRNLQRKEVIKATSTDTR